MTETYSRRDALKTIAIVCGAAGVLGRTNTAQADVPHLAVGDPMAKAMSYTENGAAVDAKAFPMYQTGSTCANCMQSPAAAGAGYRTCNIFPGKAVAAGGWCKAWAKKA